MLYSVKKQSGAAAIWFVFVAVAIMGMGALGVEGARYITEKAHLGDVMEATAVAVSESDDIRDDTKNEGDFTPEQKQKAEAIAKSWIAYLVPDRKNAEVKVTRSKDQTIKTKDGGCVKGIDGKCIKRTVHKYSIASSITQDSWMYMKGVPSFDKQQKVYNKATAARIRTDFEPVDVVFVSDFSGSMKSHKRLWNLKKAIEGVTQTIFDATEELKRKHPTEKHKINDSSFGFVPFTKRIVVKRDGKYYCSSMLKSNPGTSYWRPMKDINLSDIATERKENEYSGQEWWVMNTYSSYALQRGGGWVMPLDCNHGEWHYSSDRGQWSKCSAPYSDHIDYSYTARNIQLFKNYELSTPIEMRPGSSLKWDRYCSSFYDGTPKYHNIDRSELKTQNEVDSFNRQVQLMSRDYWGREDPGGGTDMYQGLLAAPGQFEGAKNKNRFIFVLSDGAENNSSFKKLVDNGLCKTIRNDLSKNAKGETTKFEMFVIGLKFKNDDEAYKKCFGKHIYEVQDLNKLKDVIMELLSTTTSYNVDRK